MPKNKQSNPVESRLAIVRNAELRAASLVASVERERITLFVRFPRAALLEVLRATVAMAFNCVYAAHELVECRTSLHFDAACMRCDSAAVISEATHHAAFRRSLGNSLLCADFAVNARTTVAAVQRFKRAAMRRATPCIVVEGASLDELLACAANDHVKTLLLGAETAADGDEAFVAANSSEYFGGEVRIAAHAADRHNHVVFAYPATALHIEETAEAVAVLHQLLRDAQQRSPLVGGTQAADSPAKTAAFCHVHSDAALLGVSVAFPCHASTNRPQIAADWLRDAHRSLLRFASVDDVRLRFEVARQAACFAVASDSLGVEGTLRSHAKALEATGKPFDRRAACQRIARQTPETVAAAAQRCFSHRPTVAAFGVTAEIPFADEFLG